MARPRRLDPDEMRLQIVATARQILREAGSAALTARALAQPLNIPASAIYRIFPTMADVVMAVNQATFAELQAVFDAMPATGTPYERLLHVAHGYMEFMRQNPSLWRALFAGERNRGDYPQWYLEAIKSLMQRLAGLVHENCPHLAQATAEEAAGRLYVMAHGAISLELDGRLSLFTTLTSHEFALTSIRSLLAELRQTELA